MRSDRAALAAIGMAVALLTACASQPLSPIVAAMDRSPGYRGPIPDVPVKVNVLDMGARADGRTDDSGAIQRAIDSLEVPGAVLLPAGAYLLRSSIRLKSGVVLRGEGKDATHLVVDAPDAAWDGAIQASGDYASEAIPITGGADAGSTRLIVADAEGIAPGAVVRVYADNDPEVMYTEPDWNESWADEAVGQIVDVVAVEGDRVMLGAPLRVNHPEHLNPRLRVIAPVTDFGIERLHIRRLDQAEDYIISIDLADNGWIRECDLAWATRGHVAIAESRHITVQSNDIHHAYDYGGGGRGYGIAVSRTNDSRFEDNLIYTIRHSFMVSLGSNGNVFAYNYSRDHRSTEPFDLADVAIHGHYAHANLFEGNVADNIRVSDWWGPTPYTTLYRNRVISDITVQDHSHFVNIVGNTVLGDGGIEIEDNVENAFVAHNRIAGELQPGDAGVERNLPASLWRVGKPGYWGDRPWPCTGADVDTGAILCRIPAQDRDPDRAAGV